LVVVSIVCNGPQKLGAVLGRGFQPVLVALSRQDHHHAFFVSRFVKQSHQWVATDLPAAHATVPSMTLSLPRRGDEVMNNLGRPKTLSPEPQWRRYAAFFDVRVKGAYADSQHCCQFGRG